MIVHHTEEKYGDRKKFDLASRWICTTSFGMPWTKKLKEMSVCVCVQVCTLYIRSQLKRMKHCTCFEKIQATYVRDFGSKYGYDKFLSVKKLKKSTYVWSKDP